MEGEFKKNTNKGTGEAQRRWGVVSKVLKNMEETVWSQAMMYKAVVQTVLLYGRYSYVVTEAILKVI